MNAGTLIRLTLTLSTASGALLAKAADAPPAPVPPQAERLSLKEDMLMREEAERKTQKDREKLRSDRVSKSSRAQFDADREGLRQDRRWENEQKAREIYDQTEQGVKDINERGRQGRP